MTTLDEIDAIDTCITILEHERKRLYPLMNQTVKPKKIVRDYLEVVRTLNGLFNLMNKLQEKRHQERLNQQESGL